MPNRSAPQLVTTSDLIKFTDSIEKYCHTKETLFEMLNPKNSENLPDETRFVIALQTCDRYFAGPSHDGNYDGVYNLKTTFINTLFYDSCSFEKKGHVDLRDSLYLRCLNVINKIYYEELRADQIKHPSRFFCKSKEQHYELRTKQMRFSSQLNEVITNLYDVLAGHSFKNLALFFVS